MRRAHLACGADRHRLCGPYTIEELIHTERWESTAWRVANMYITSLGGRPLGDGSFSAVGMSEETTCFVTLTYFLDDDPFADFVVHECAHVFHNCKRGTVGLPQTRHREWLQNIDFVHRETFAYACEAHRRIIERASTRRERLRLVEARADSPPPPCDQVDFAEYMDILKDAAGARNGWKRIRERCAPPPRKSRAEAREQFVRECRDRMREGKVTR